MQKAASSTDLLTASLEGGAQMIILYIKVHEAQF